MIEGLIATGVVLTTLAELAFVVGYVRVPWWRTAEGRMMMAKDSAILLVLGLAVLGTFAPDLPARPAIRAAVWTVLPVVFIWKAVLFYRRQAEGRRQIKERDDAPSL